MTDDEKRAYKEEYIQNKQTKRHGLSANEYAAMKEAEKMNELRHALEDENQRLVDEVNEKIGDLEDAQDVDSVPSGLAEFVIGKVKEMYTNFYANCEKTWWALQKKRDSVKNRARDISLRFGNLLEADERKHDDDSQYC